MARIIPTTGDKGTGILNTLLQSKQALSLLEKIFTREAKGGIIDLRGGSADPFLNELFDAAKEDEENTEFTPARAADFITKEFGHPDTTDPYATKKPNVEGEEEIEQSKKSPHPQERKDTEPPAPPSPPGEEKERGEDEDEQAPPEEKEPEQSPTAPQIPQSELAGGAKPHADKVPQAQAKQPQKDNQPALEETAPPTEPGETNGEQGQAAVPNTAEQIAGSPEENLDTVPEKTPQEQQGAKTQPHTPATNEQSTQKTAPTQPEETGEQKPNGGGDEKEQHERALEYARAGLMPTHGSKTRTAEEEKAHRKKEYEKAMHSREEEQQEPPFQPFDDSEQESSKAEEQSQKEKTKKDTANQDATDEQDQQSEDEDEENDQEEAQGEKQKKEKETPERSGLTQGINRIKFRKIIQDIDTQMNSLGEKRKPIEKKIQEKEKELAPLKRKHRPLQALYSLIKLAEWTLIAIIVVFILTGIGILVIIIFSETIGAAFAFLETRRRPIKELKKILEKQMEPIKKEISGLKKSLAAINKQIQTLATQRRKLLNVPFYSSGIPQK